MAKIWEIRLCHKLIEITASENLPTNGQANAIESLILVGWGVQGVFEQMTEPKKLKLSELKLRHINLNYFQIHHEWPGKSGWYLFFCWFRNSEVKGGIWAKHWLK